MGTHEGNGNSPQIDPHGTGQVAAHEEQSQDSGQAVPGLHYNVRSTPRRRPVAPALQPSPGVRDKACVCAMLPQQVRILAFADDIVVIGEQSGRQCDSLLQSVNV